MRFLDLMVPFTAISEEPWLLVGAIFLVAGVVAGTGVLLFGRLPSREKQETGGDDASPSDGL